MPFKKADPAAAAQAAVDKLEAQRARLAKLLDGAVSAVESAQAARRAVLIDGDPSTADMEKHNRACAAAVEARAGVEEAARVVATQLEDVLRQRDALADAAAREALAGVALRRAAALDAAAEALADAAKVFDAARAALVSAVAEHGVAIVNPLSTGGTPPWLVCQPAVQAALRAANPGFTPPVDGFGAALDTDCALVMRREQSGRLRDFVEDVRAGTVPAVELPRPSASPPDPNNTMAAEPMVRAVFSEAFTYLAAGGRNMVQGDRGDVEVPRRVAAAAKELGIAFDPGTPKAAAVLREIKAGPAPGYMKTPGRPATRAFFVDTDEGVIDSAPARTADWPEVDREVRRDGSLRVRA